MRLLLEHAHVPLVRRRRSTARAKATGLIGDPTNDLFLSCATVWELAIKVGLNKLALSQPFLPFFTKTIATASLALLAISIDDCDAYAALKFPDPNHRDPFDRLIIVHANRNGLAVLNADAAFDSYGVNRIW